MADINVTAAQVALTDPLKADVVPMIAAVTITAGQAVYQDNTGRARLTDASAANTAQVRGIALNPAVAGQPVGVVRTGDLYGLDLSGADPDDPIWLSDTAGALDDGVGGTVKVPVGRVRVLTDAAAAKVLYVCADWLRAWT